MTYFEDLSHYTYQDVDAISTGSGYVIYRPDYERLNVGWIDQAHPAATGPVPDGFLDALLDIVDGDLTNVMRGFHLCHLCPRTPETGMPSIEHRGKRVPLGHAEIRVPAHSGVMFAAPTLIAHYVKTHGYQPPEMFVRAVLVYEDFWMTDPASPWIPATADRLTF